MSILIKGMEMPKDGCHHMICIYADGTVSTGERVYTAISVPTPHGPLTDIDKLINTLKGLFNKREEEARFTGNREVPVTWNDAIYYIKNAQVIIEEEKGEEA